MWARVYVYAFKNFKFFLRWMVFYFNNREINNLWGFYNKEMLYLK